MVVARNIIFAVGIFIGIAFLQSCSNRGVILLHNASGGAVVVEIFTYQYQLAAEETVEIRIDPIFGKDQFTIRTTRNLLCYEMAKVAPNWIKPGFFHAKVFGILDATGKIY